MKSLKVGIVGLGRIAALYEDDPRARRYYPRLTHAGSYAKDGRVEIICGADTDPARLRRFGRMFGVKRLYGDYRKMLDDNRIDILSVCTHPALHYRIIRDASRHVKVVFCEKPFTMGSGEIRKVLALQKRTGLRIGINLYRQYDVAHELVRKMVDSGKIGKVQRINCYYGKGLRNMGSHLLAYVMSMLGVPNTVRVLRKSPGSRADDASYDVYLEFSGRVPCMLQSCDFDLFRIFEIDIIGEKGRIRILDEGLTIRISDVRDNRAESGARELVESRTDMKSTIGSALGGAVSNMVDLARSSGARPVYPPERYLALQLLIEKIERQGRRL